MNVQYIEPYPCGRIGREAAMLRIPSKMSFYALTSFDMEFLIPDYCLKRDVL